MNAQQQSQGRSSILEFSFEFSILWPGLRNHVDTPLSAKLEAADVVRLAIASEGAIRAAPSGPSLSSL